MHPDSRRYVLTDGTVITGQKLEIEAVALRRGDFVHGRSVTFIGSVWFNRLSFPPGTHPRERTADNPQRRLSDPWFKGFQGPKLLYAWQPAERVRIIRPDSGCVVPDRLRVIDHEIEEGPQ
jgi:hypothetical protein